MQKSIRRTVTVAALAAAIVGVGVAPALAETAESAPASATTTAPSMHQAGFSGDVVNNLPYAVDVYYQPKSFEPEESVHLEPGATEYICTCSPVEGSNRVRAYVSGAPTRTLVADGGVYAETSVGGEVSLSFNLLAPNVDGSVFSQWTPFEAKRTPSTTGFPSGRVIKTTVSVGATGELVLGGLADLPAGGSDLTVVNQSSTPIGLTGRSISPGDRTTVAFNATRETQPITQLSLRDKNGSTRYLDLGLSQAQPRYETNFNITYSGTRFRLLNVDTRDRLNQTLGAHQVTDQANYTLTRSWDTDGKAHFILTVINN